MSAIHGVLLISVLAVPVILNKIPLATLATILILVDINWPNRRPLFTFGGKYQFIPLLLPGSCSNNDPLKGVL
jgi:MFS superfamily sulfate permease-like transporter